MNADLKIELNIENTAGNTIGAVISQRLQDATTNEEQLIEAYKGFNTHMKAHFSTLRDRAMDKVSLLDDIL